MENGLHFELPRAIAEDISLSVTEQTDSLLVQVQATAAYTNQPLYLAATIRGIAYVRGKMELKNGLYTLTLAKNIFPSGLVRFTIYDKLFQPTNERAVFIWHKDDMKLELASDKQVYGTRDTVNLSIKIKGYAPEDSIAFFSLVVIDTSQIQYSKYRENIVSYMLLSSDLKGEVEDSYYYLTNPVPGAVEALMLTQGWVKYNRSADSVFQFSPEKEFMISGRVTNVNNKGLAGFNLLLKGQDVAEKIFTKHSITDQHGRFLFKGFPPLKDSAGFSITAFEKNANALLKSFDAIKIDELPPYVLPEDIQYVREQLELDTVVRTYIDKQVRTKRGKDFLEEVVVKARGKIPGSHLMGTSDYVFTDFEDDMNFSTFFHTEVRPKLPKPPQKTKLKTVIVAFFADGVFGGFDWVSGADPAYDSAYRVMKEGFLMLYSMKNDIKAVEVLTDRKSVMAYQNKYGWHQLINSYSTNPLSEPNFNKMIYYIVEVTTYAGGGPWMYRPNPYYNNSTHYFPLIPVVAKEFYQPKYSSPLKENELPQLPATVYWKNYLIPDNNGVLNAGFYTSDSPNNYLIIVQGMNMKGQLGFMQQTLPVKKE